MIQSKLNFVPVTRRVVRASADYDSDETIDAREFPHLAPLVQGVNVSRDGYLVFQGSDTKIKVTDDFPRKIGVISTIINICATTNRSASKEWFRLKAEFPEIFKELDITEGTAGCRTLDFGFSLYKFEGKGQNFTPVVDLRTWVKLVLKLHSKKAASFQDFVADKVVRYLGGDQTLVDEINQIASVSTRDNNPFVERRYPQELFPPQPKTLANRVPDNKRAMAAIKDTTNSSPFYYGTYNHELNCAVTGCKNTEQLKETRGYPKGKLFVDENGKKRHCTGRDVMTDFELASVNQANRIFADVIPALGFLTATKEVTDLCRNMREQVSTLLRRANLE